MCEQQHECQCRLMRDIVLKEALNSAPSKAQAKVSLDCSGRRHSRRRLAFTEGSGQVRLTRPPG